jgi:hypothetical protein
MPETVLPPSSSRPAYRPETQVAWRHVGMMAL